MLNSTNRFLFLPLFLFLVFQQTWLASGSPDRQRSFHRPDPLQHFKDYNGDFDVRNKHYVAVSSFSLQTKLSLLYFLNSLLYVYFSLDFRKQITCVWWSYVCLLHLLSDPFQSAAFTGVHGYAFACVWLLCGLVLAIFLIVKCLCGGSASLTCLDHYYLHIFFLLLSFTSLAM